jgi:hypothetical protein
MTGLVQRLLTCGALFGAMTSPSLGQSCADWQQSCANAYGGGPGFHSCMGQPGAVAACGGGYGGDGGGYAIGGNGSCASWRRTCAEMWGGGYQWRQCMRQPGALYACGRF